MKIKRKKTAAVVAAQVILVLIIAVAPLTSRAQKREAKASETPVTGTMVAVIGIGPEALLHERSYREFASIFGLGHQACDTARHTLPDGRVGDAMTFAPVEMLGYHIVLEANVVRDTVRSLLARLIPHVKGLRTLAPKAPYSTRTMGIATLDDLSAFGKVLSKEYGEPSVSTETYLLYFANSTHPTLNVNLKDGMITMEITPAASH